mgnify:CR=1 FL=1
MYSGIQGRWSWDEVELCSANGSFYPWAGFIVTNQRLHDSALPVCKAQFDELLTPVAWISTRYDMRSIRHRLLRQIGRNRRLLGLVNIRIYFAKDLTGNQRFEMARPINLYAVQLFIGLLPVFRTAYNNGGNVDAALRKSRTKGARRCTEATDFSPCGNLV